MATPDERLPMTSFELPVSLVPFFSFSFSYKSHLQRMSSGSLLVFSLSLTPTCFSLCQLEALCSRINSLQHTYIPDFLCHYLAFSSLSSAQTLTHLFFTEQNSARL